MTHRVREILSWYTGDNPGTVTNLARLLGAGRLGGTGRLLILPVDHGFEHGPASSFAANPPAYDPRYLAVEAGASALAAPLGTLEAGAREFAGCIPLILKINAHDLFGEEADPTQAVVGSVRDALRLGCIGVGYTVYPGSRARFDMYDRLREVIRDAKEQGLVVVVLSYPRGGILSADDQTAVDVVAYAARIAVELGGHVVKVKIPSARVSAGPAAGAYAQIPIERPADRIHHVVEAAFGGRRLVLFSGGSKIADQALLDEIRAVRDSGGSGSIIGRNVFQRPEAAAKRLLAEAVDILAV